MYKKEKVEIYLEKFNKGDFHRYYNLVGNEKVMAMITERALSENEAKESFKRILRDDEIIDSLGHYKVMESETDKFIGSVMLRVKEKNSKEAELGYMLLPDYWGKGIGSEIAALMIEKAKAKKQIKKIIAIIDPNNKASRKILINKGFVCEKVCEIDGLPAEIFSIQI